MNLLNQAYHVLEGHNLRITPQRDAVLQILCDYRGDHLDIENIYALITMENNMNIGLATVYRTMDLFERVGLVSRLTVEKSPAQYELIIDKDELHHHLICLKCGDTQEIQDKDIDDFKTFVYEKTGFQITQKSMEIYGYCRKCRRQP